MTEILLQIFVIVILFGIIEFGLFSWVSYVRKNFQWLIISKYDENP